MDVFSILSYINKISLVAFFITTLAVGYQIYILKKEKSKEQAPTIPDFKENNSFNTVANFTKLPSSLTKKELKSVNYSKLVFLIITLLTIIVIIIVISLINKNNTSRNQVSINPKITVTKAPTISRSKEVLSPTQENTLVSTSENTLTSIPDNALTSAPLPTDVIPTVVSEPTIGPTEIILANNSSTELTEVPTESVVNIPQELPETGSWGKGLLIIGVAISTIFFSFWL